MKKITKLEQVFTHEDWIKYVASIIGRSGGLKGGKSTSKAKQRASKLNGKKGGRPKKGEK